MAMAWRQTRVPCHVLKTVLLASMLKPDEAKTTAVAAVGYLVCHIRCLFPCARPVLSAQLHRPGQMHPHSKSSHPHPPSLHSPEPPGVRAPPLTRPVFHQLLSSSHSPIAHRPCVTLTKRPSLVGEMRILAGMSCAALDRPPKVPSRMMPGAHVSRPTRKLRAPLICMFGLRCHVLAAALDAIWHIRTGDPIA